MAAPRGKCYRIGVFMIDALMTKVCTNCGVAPVIPEPEPPPGATAVPAEPTDPKKCPNCGHEGELQDVAEPEEKSVGEEDAE